MSTVEIEVDLDALGEELKELVEHDVISSAEASLEGIAEEVAERAVEEGVDNVDIDGLAGASVDLAVENADIDELVSRAVSEYDFDVVVSEEFNSSALGRVVEKFERELLTLKNKVAELEKVHA